MNIAIIPARHGSKRIKLKNIKIFYSKPIIFWTIKKLIKTKIFDLIVVTSDSSRILNISKKFGANVLIKRPKIISNDEAPTNKVIIHAIDYLKAQGINISTNSSICCVYPCNPFILVKDLKKAFFFFKKDSSKFVLSVTEYSHPIQRALQLNKNFLTKPFFKNNLNENTQNFRKSYFDAGQFCFGSENLWKTKKNSFRGSRSIIIPSWRSVDIDDMSDWKRAEILFKNYKSLLKIR